MTPGVQPVASPLLATKTDRTAQNEDTTAAHLAGTESAVLLETPASVRLLSTHTFLELRPPTSPRALLENERGSETATIETATEIVITEIETIGIATTVTETAITEIAETTETEKETAIATEIAPGTENADANAAANAVETVDAPLPPADDPPLLPVQAMTNHRSSKMLHTTPTRQFSRSFAASRPRGSIVIPPGTDHRNVQSAKVDPPAHRDAVLHTPAPRATDIAPEDPDRRALLDVVLPPSLEDHEETRRVGKTTWTSSGLVNRIVDAALTHLTIKMPGHPSSYERDISPRRSRSPHSFSKSRSDKRPRRRKSPHRRNQSPVPRNSDSPAHQRPSTGSSDDVISALATKKETVDNAPREDTHHKLEDGPRMSAEPASPKPETASKSGENPPPLEPVRSLSPYSKRRNLGDAPPLRDTRGRETIRPRPGQPPFPKGPREKDFDRRGPPPASNARSRRRKQRRGVDTYSAGDEHYRRTPSPHRSSGPGSKAMPGGSHPQDYADEYDRASSVSSIDSRGNDRRSTERSPYSGRRERRADPVENNATAQDDVPPSPKDADELEHQALPPASPPPPPPPSAESSSRAERDAALMPPPNAPRGPRGDSSLDASPKPSPIDASKGKVRFSLSGTAPKGKLPTGPRNQEFGLMRRVLGTASNSVPVAPRKHGAPSTSTPSEAPTPKATKTLPTPRVLISRKVPFDRVGLVGEGTYGQVFKAKNWVTGHLVALKRVRMTAEKDGFPITAAREIKILQSLAKGRDSDKIIHLLDNMVEQNGFYMIFEYMDHDLTGILHHPSYRLTEANIKDLAHQFFSGLAHVHRSGILHRDIKSSNILINKHGMLKIADFGLARQYDKLKKDQHYTNRIITLWYRPVEILLGETVYTTGPDVWSAGCVFMELFTRKAIFQGSNEITQLDIIWNLLGTPTHATWPGWKDTAWHSMLRPEHYHKPIFNERFKRTVPADALALASRIFTYDPKKRPTAEEVLADPYFTNEPKAERTVSIETIEGEWHELESKKNRKREREERLSAARQAKQP
ncbi:hypothetical protein Dda_8524 [Drechslerella dactyloides]|uniref:cyclin-dependent kinase n=1 Tax=Drechslerella dactyloides TaxID=74499 RepID=A0AAD6NFX3_DREDA|nr:hypothetical protein Dda_8524 [Drechslerella dactyloides]